MKTKKTKFGFFFFVCFLFIVSLRYASFDRHKFVFRRSAKSVVNLVRSRAPSCYSDARGMNVVQPLSESKQRLFQVLGTPNYMAVEILKEQEQGYDSTCDWWSVGCIIFELL